MSKIKLNLEIEQEVYDNLQKQFDDISQSSNSKIKFANLEEYIASVLYSFTKGGEQMKKMNSKLSDLLEKFGGELGNMDFGDLDLGSMFGVKSEPKKQDEPKKEDTSKLKN
ncbi:hypothetical protein FACS1894166_01940 [Bacilli bacterium]|nr:hypothetical protein FACS1894166_01940 [Bacilli bacterium]